MGKTVEVTGVQMAAPTTSGHNPSRVEWYACGTTRPQLGGSYGETLPAGCKLLLDQTRNAGGVQTGWQPTDGLAKATGRYFAFTVRGWGSHGRWQRYVGEVQFLTADPTVCTKTTRKTSTPDTRVLRAYLPSSSGAMCKVAMPRASLLKETTEKILDTYEHGTITPTCTPNAHSLPHTLLTCHVATLCPSARAGRPCLARHVAGTTACSPATSTPSSNACGRPREGSPASRLAR